MVDIKKINKLKKEIQSTPWKYSLHQLLTILELLEPNSSEFGSGRSPKDEPAILKAYCNFAVPPSDCVEYKEVDEIKELTINQTSLVGINGILPQLYSEKITSQTKENNFKVIDFLNIIHQRFFGISHKIEKKAQINLNRIQLNQFEYHKAIAGVLEEGSAKLHKQVLPSFAALMWHKNRNVLGLKTILQNIFPKLKSEIKQFIPTWFKINSSCQARLNKDLLIDKILGKKAISIQFSIKIILNLKTKEDYDSFLPGEKNCNLIKQIVQYYCPPGFKIQYELNLPKKEKAFSRISRKQKLGYSAWLNDFNELDENSNEMIVGCTFN